MKEGKTQTKDKKEIENHKDQVNMKVKELDNNNDQKQKTGWWSE